jgi:hypothetical protein
MNKGRLVWGEIDRQCKFVDGILVRPEDQAGDLTCPFCLRVLRGHYYSVNDAKGRNILMCVRCFKLVQTLRRMNWFVLFKGDLDFDEVKPGFEK